MMEDDLKGVAQRISTAVDEREMNISKSLLV